MVSQRDIKIKVCGLRDNVQAVASLPVDYLGFIFYPKSPRYVGEDFIMPETSQLKIGVFVNQPVEDVLNSYSEHHLDYVQLHGNESIDYCVELKAYGVNIIKVFSGDNPPDQQNLLAYQSFIDFYLFDNRNNDYGGTGKSFDLANLKDFRLSKPVFLSGGISLKNVEKYVNSGLNIHSIDVNSQFEISPGNKDIELVRQLIEQVKGEKV